MHQSFSLTCPSSRLRVLFRICAGFRHHNDRASRLGLFVARATFRPRRLAGRNLSYKADSALLSGRELHEVHEQVKEILEAQAPLEATAGNKLAVFGRSLVSIVRDLRTLSFFESVWLPFSGEQDTSLP